MIGHGDSHEGNVRLTHGQVVAASDWDLIVEDEAILVGLAAGAFTTHGAPSARDVTGFISDVAAARGGFSREQLGAARAAAQWIRAFNTRCELSNLGNRSDHIARNLSIG